MLSWTWAVPLSKNIQYIVYFASGTSSPWQSPSAICGVPLSAAGQLSRIHRRVSPGRKPGATNLPRAAGIHGIRTIACGRICRASSRRLTAFPPRVPLWGMRTANDCAQSTHFLVAPGRVHRPNLAAKHGRDFEVGVGVPLARLHLYSHAEVLAQLRAARVDGLAMRTLPHGAP